MVIVILFKNKRVKRPTLLKLSALFVLNLHYFLSEASLLVVE